MSGAFEIGKVALRAQQRALDTTANNIANVNTPGFKRADVIFSDVFAETARPATQAEALALAESGLPGGVRVDTRSALFAQGEIKQTGNAMDLAIEGAGLIELLGPDGETLLWRGGRLSVNPEGYLAGPEGLALRALISVPDDVETMTIDRTGLVVAKAADGEELELGQLTLVRVGSEAELEQAGHGLYRAVADARVIDEAPGEAGTGTFAQGAIEQSNVDFSAAMIELLMIQRAYAASAQIVQSADQLASIANNLKR